MFTDYNKGDKVRVWRGKDWHPPLVEPPCIGHETVIQGPHRSRMFPETIDPNDPSFNTTDGAYWYSSELDLVEKFVNIHDGSPMRGFN